MPIYIGLGDEDKLKVIADYREQHGISHVVHFKGFGYLEVPDAERFKASQMQAFSEFYRLIKEIGKNTLIIVDEFLTVQNRYSPQYNTIMHFIKQTDHVLIFNYLPQIDESEDFMTLFDLDTKGKWRGRKFDVNLIHEHSKITCYSRVPKFEFIELPENKAQSKQYEKRKKELFETIGLRDPHMIPRQLYMVGHFYKINSIRFLKEINDYYISRSWSTHKNIFGYKEAKPLTPYIILEFQHRFVDMIKFFQTTQQPCYKVMVSQLKVDHWYKTRYSEWRDRVEEVCKSLRQ